MDMSTKARSTGLDIARGSAVILMVVYHMCYWPSDTVSSSLKAASQALSAFRMPLLFLISGFLAAGLTHKPKREALARISNLVWLYLLWLPIMIITSPDASQFQPGRVLENIWRPWTELWFIWALAILITSLFIIKNMSRRTVLLASLVVATADYSGVFGLTFSHDNLLRYAPMFYVGALYRTELTNLMRSRFSAVPAIMIAVAIVGVHVSASYFQKAHGWQVLGPIERMVLCVAAIYFIKPLEKLPAVGGWLASVGQKTLPIYLAHLPLWTILRPRMPGLGGIVTPLLSASLLVVICLLIHQVTPRLRLQWLFKQPAWWSKGITRLAIRAAWAADNRLAFR